MVFHSGLIFNNLESSIIRFVSSFVQHAWPDSYVFVIAVPIAAALTVTGGKIFHLFLSRIPNRYFEYFGYISGHCVYKLPPLLLFILLKAGINSFLWGLAIHLLKLPHGIEFAVFMGLAAFIPFWGIWIGGIFPLFVFLQRSVSWTSFIGLIITLAVIRLVNYIMGAAAVEPNWTVWDPYICLFLLVLGFILFGFVGMFTMGIFYSFITVIHTFLTAGNDLVHDNNRQDFNF